MTVRSPCRQSTVLGSSRTFEAYFWGSSSPLLQMRMGRPSLAVTCCRAFMHFWRGGGDGLVNHDSFAMIGWVCEKAQGDMNG